MSRRFLGMAWAAWMLCASGLSLSTAEAGEKALNVVELFTSQGCSACPPADRLLTELAARDDVLALSFHVDYWDYTGWPDSFAKPEFGKRQRRYAKVFHRNSVYTPQIVVNGTGEATGSDRAAVLGLLDKASAEGRVAIDIARENNGLRIIANAADGTPAADLWLISFDKERAVDIRKGENQGRNIRYSNVVRSLWKVGTWDGTAAELTVRPADLPGETGESWAAILQVRGDGRIIGVTRLENQP
jgi:hypothetical protein